MEKGKAPSFKSDGMAIWVNTKPDGEKYLSVKILNQFVINCYKNKPRPKPQPTPEENVL